MTEPPASPPSPWRRRARWFAAEFAVVVSGVLVALALNAWWVGQQEADLEAVYLDQLTADLTETLGLIEAAEDQMAEADRAGAELVRAFQRPEPPPADSLLVWIRTASRYRVPAPVTGTAEALVTTGDLTLIQDDTLRAAIVSYLRESRLISADFAKDVAAWEAARDALFRTVDYQEVLATVLPDSARNALAARYADFPIPPGPRQARFPFEPEALLSDRDAYHAITRMNAAKTNMRWDREALEAQTRALRQRTRRAR